MICIWNLTIVTILKRKCYIFPFWFYFSHSKYVWYDDKNTRILTTCTKMCWCQRTFQVCVNLSKKRMKRTIQNEFYLKWYNPCLILWASSLERVDFCLCLTLHYIINAVLFFIRYIFHTTLQLNRSKRKFCN